MISRRRQRRCPSATLTAVLLAAAPILSSLVTTSCSYVALTSLVVAVSSVVSASDAHTASSNQSHGEALKCSGGWTDSSAASADVETTTVEIPMSWINDGYCDCPYDGLDEPDTEACSGSSSWPGIKQHSVEEKESPVFRCPQQPKLKLPLSRLYDRVCDCCDGADEADGSCQDICEEVLREEREARARLESNFQIGSKKRLDDLEAFKSLRDSKLKELEEKEKKITALQDDITAVQAQMRDLKQDYAKSRMVTMKEVVVPGFEDLLSGLDREELQSLIVHSCQVAGELLSSSQPDNTCVALRMAGLDMALTWSDDDFDDLDNMTGGIDSTMELVNLLFDNASDGQRMKWRLEKSNSKNTGNDNNRRRLDEVFDDDGMEPDLRKDMEQDPDIDDEYRGRYNYDGMDDEYDGYYGTDDYIPDHDHLVDGVDTADNEAVNDESSQGGKKKEFIDEVKATKFSSSRILFLDRAKRVIDEITVVLETPPPQTDSDGETDKDDQDDVSVEGDAHVESTMESESPKDNFDPTAYTMVRSELRKLESSILKGYNWAASAKLLFSFSEQSDHNLKRLAVGTLYYGQVSSLQLWQILQSILPEYAADGTASDGTCSSPWASSCPPKALPRKSEGETFPPKYILNAGAKFCDEQMVVLNSAMGGSCPASSSSSSEDGNMTVDIPSSIPDGYYGYSKPLSRTEDDPFTSLFSPIDSLPVDKDGLQELENKKKDLDKEKREIQNEVNNDWKDIGGKDGTEMGPDGELHVLANQCISVDAGKYTYETCIFGKATQRDIGQKVGGTGLGSWKGMSIDDESGRRVMTWDGGMKCWNGPQRSATVYISCGAETKLISADEPDTCRYVMEMESHIACDEAYRVANDL